MKGLHRSTSRNLNFMDSDECRKKKWNHRIKYYYKILLKLQNLSNFV